MGVPLADVDGVAIGRGARDRPTADRAAGAADILDDDRLAERSPILSAMMRAATSVEPPGGNGTISVIGREGKLSAWAGNTSEKRKRNAIATIIFACSPPRVRASFHQIDAARPPA